MSTRSALPPGSTIGILGGGQLGRMLAMAAARLGLKSRIFCPAGDNPACQVADGFTEAAYEDGEALDRFAASVDVVTYEFENVPSETAARLAARVPVRPGELALKTSQDRLDEKEFLNRIGLTTAPYAAVDSLADLQGAVDRIGLPGVLKTRRFGYDGKGQVMIRTAADVSEAFDAIGAAPCIYEGFVDFTCEVSVIGARSVTGEIVSYTPGENIHTNHILDLTLVPASLSDASLARAEDQAATILAGLDYVGVMGLELFVTRDEDLIVNEIAPRVHNSGHWTLEACPVSQFEQHVRAIAGWPLGSGGRHSDAIMKNLIGEEIDRWSELAARPDTGMHHYGKAATRPGRKMGHATRIYPLGSRPDRF